MAVTCPECGAEHESIDEFETTTVEEVNEEDDGSISVYGNKTDLYLCKGCRKPMGAGHKTAGEK